MKFFAPSSTWHFPRPSDYKIDFDIGNVRANARVVGKLLVLCVYIYICVRGEYFSFIFFLLLLLLLWTYTHAYSLLWAWAIWKEAWGWEVEVGWLLFVRSMREKEKMDKLKLICCVVLCNHFNVVTDCLALDLVYNEGWMRLLWSI